ncbi:hypothetical protein IV38_GL000283 [Lactobacillus selangorensis]|uniref:Metallo-beta-lactamase domain-containing protein n=2 Tax=Lactobacillus selangorensis TaxID=81857 RepID=A0A0R2FV76_9LACO|nr:hypothetical protein IV38_GL000283 [Lactobacillus selangorensis]KRN34072.1 hypothetical protein IV40_GL000386 [Lactobacillus selangorensis]
MLKMQQKSVLTAAAILGSLFALRCWQAQALQQSPPRPTATTLTVQPDQVRTSGDLVFMTGRTAENIRVQGIYRLRSPAEKQAYQQIYRKQRWMVTGTYERLQPATNEGEFDYARYQGQQQHIFYQLQAETIDRQTNLPYQLGDGIHWLRAAVQHYCRQLPPRLADHARQLLLGDRSESDREYQQELGQLGIIHLFSLSGLHVYSLIAGLYGITTVLKIPREWCRTALLVLLPVGCVLAGAGTGLRRAVLFSWFGLLCQCLQIRTARLDRFSIVLIGELFLNPYLLFSFGGVLSYLMAGGLIYCTHRSEWQRLWFLTALNLPICLLMRSEWHLLTLLLNLVAAPLFVHLIVPLTLIGAAVFPILPSLSQLIEWFFTVLMQQLSWLAQVPQFNFVFGQPEVWLVLLLLGATLHLNQQFNQKRRRHAWVRLGCYYFIALISIRWLPFGKVVFFDIGQGDSILIEMPFKRGAVLIDTGGKLSFQQEKWQERTASNRVETITLPYLKKEGIRSLDAVILSHQDADHIGDLAVLLKRFPVREVVYGQGLEQNPQFQRKMAPFLDRVQLHPVLAGSQLRYAGQKFDILAPSRPGLGTNEDSVVVHFQMGTKRWLLTGDLDRDGEQKLLQQPFAVDYLKAGHHGSHTASDPAALKKWHPEKILISVGRKNRYGHPHPDVLATYHTLGIPFETTAQRGMITWYDGYRSHFTYYLKKEPPA